MGKYVDQIVPVQNRRARVTHKVNIDRYWGGREGDVAGTGIAKLESSVKGLGVGCVGGRSRRIVMGRVGYRVRLW